MDSRGITETLRSLVRKMLAVCPPSSRDIDDIVIIFKFQEAGSLRDGEDSRLSSTVDIVPKGRVNRALFTRHARFTWMPGITGAFT